MRTKFKTMPLSIVILISYILQFGCVSSTVSTDEKNQITMAEIYYEQIEENIEDGPKYLPNPTLRMYVFAHFVGEEQIPIPGYATKFNLYQKPPYALEGES